MRWPGTTGGRPGRCSSPACTARGAVPSTPAPGVTGGWGRRFPRTQYGYIRLSPSLVPVRGQTRGGVAFRRGDVRGRRPDPLSRPGPRRRADRRHLRRAGRRAAHHGPLARGRRSAADRGGGVGAPRRRHDRARDPRLDPPGLTTPRAGPLVPTWQSSGDARRTRFPEADMERRTPTVSDVVRRAVELCDPDDVDQVLGRLEEQFEDDDE